MSMKRGTRSTKILTLPEDYDQAYSKAGSRWSDFYSFLGENGDIYGYEQERRMKRNDTKEFLESFRTSTEDAMVKALLIDNFEQVLIDIKNNETIDDYFDEEGEINHNFLIKKLDNIARQSFCESCRVPQ